MPAAKRTGGKSAGVVAGDTAAGRRAARQAQGPGVSTDTDRDRAYKQGQGAARRALDERRRGRPARGPAQVHADPELQDIYEQGHRQTVSDARRTAVRTKVGGAVAPAASSAKSVGENGAGFILGLIAFALFRNYLQGGWTGVNQWLAAKFVNKTTQPATPQKPLQYTNPKTGAKSADPPGAIIDPYKSFPGGVGGLGSFG